MLTAFMIFISASLFYRKKWQRKGFIIRVILFAAYFVFVKMLCWMSLKEIMAVVRYCDVISEKINTIIGL